MTRTPLGRAVVTLAAVQAIASRRGVAAEVIRSEWAEARSARLADDAPARAARLMSRRATVGLRLDVGPRAPNALQPLGTEAKLHDSAES